MKSFAVKLNAQTRLFWRVHRYLYQITKGRIGAHLFGWHVVLLKTIGRKTGKPRIVALNALEEQGRYIVVASYAGQDKHPAWFLNLQQRPEAEIFQDGKWIPARTAEARDGERERLWDMIIKRDSAYAEYQSRTNRKIPVITIETISGKDGR